ncbi:MAG: rod shape-determining protein MreC [Acidobacteria bacterium]|nr:rod shape-determining protein MreC [Acidobacteriota bacterium]
MDSIIGRYRNLTILIVVLFAQVLGLAVQIKRPSETGPERLIRIWTVSLITPAERAFLRVRDGVVNAWLNYVDLRGVRQENRELRGQLDRMQMERAQLEHEAGEGRRLEALLQFKQQFPAETVAARVIGSSGSEHSNLIYIDRGASDGLSAGMAVITPQGVVGKVTEVFPHTAQVLEIRDASSGVGVVLEKSRLRAVLKGAGGGATQVRFVMSDEKVEVGERVVTTGGDRIFPRGMAVGTVISVASSDEVFLSIAVKPAVDFQRLEEVLVIKRMEETVLAADDQETGRRAAEILARRLPSVPRKTDTGATPASSAKPGGAEGAVATEAPAEPAQRATPAANSGATPPGGA